MINEAEIRKNMRISHTSLDNEIKRNIDTCLLDMKRVGVNIKDDELINKACELYCKAQFDYLGKGEQFQKNYEQLRDALSLTEGYT